jgi:hypothetical protein
VLLLCLANLQLGVTNSQGQPGYDPAGECKRLARRTIAGLNECKVVLTTLALLHELRRNALLAPALSCTVAVVLLLVDLHLPKLIGPYNAACIDCAVVPKDGSLTLSWPQGKTHGVCCLASSLPLYADIKLPVLDISTLLPQK